ncbi:Retrovirus-related Pol polyprotein from transposon opus [Gossypium australe]|uniref:Retrovirus-related Pol polyprotein from transposon opus n=1 Tax=Gossypium australe TaxID=47621 RepID=A0A5B6WFE7_9ROSI|nr:Retrovirus-related Pol polyprotein from transposon opus [Gossypium australe]
MDLNQRRKMCQQLRQEKRHLNMSKSQNVIISRQVSRKLKDPGSFTIPMEIESIHFNKALCDLGASTTLMPLSIFEKLQLSDISSVHPKGLLEDVLVNVRSFIVPEDFVLLYFEEDHEISILLRRPFLATSRTTIDLEKNELTMKINGETETFKCGHQPSEEDRRKIGE